MTIDHTHKQKSHSDRPHPYLLEPILYGVQLCHGYGSDGRDLTLIILEDKDQIKVLHMELEREGRGEGKEEGERGGGRGEREGGRGEEGEEGEGEDERRKRGKVW